MQRTALSIAVLSLSLVTAAAQAQVKADGLWHGGIAIGGAASSGNTSSRTLSAAADAVNATADDKTTLFGLASYGRSKIEGVNTTTADLLRVGGRYDFNLTDLIFAFGGADAETNKSGGVKNRYNINGGVGYKLIRTDDTSWDLFAGIAYSDTKFTDNTSRSGASALLGEESTHKISDTTTFKQRLVAYPGGGEVGTRATFDAGLATAIIGGWTLNTGLSVRYASKVPVDTKKTDTFLTFGFGYKF